MTCGSSWKTIRWSTGYALACWSDWPRKRARLYAFASSRWMCWRTDLPRYSCGWVTDVSSMNLTRSGRRPSARLRTSPDRGVSAMKDRGSWSSLRSTAPRRTTRWSSNSTIAERIIRACRRNCVKLKIRYDFAHSVMLLDSTVLLRMAFADIHNFSIQWWMSNLTITFADGYARRRNLEPWVATWSGQSRLPRFTEPDVGHQQPVYPDASRSFVGGNGSRSSNSTLAGSLSVFTLLPLSTAYCHFSH